MRRKMWENAGTDGTFTVSTHRIKAKSKVKIEVKGVGQSLP
jgi:hypothetical protein